MPKLDGTGPEGESSLSGCKLGNCNITFLKEKIQKLGKGMGKSSKSGGGKGRGKRLKSKSI